jgi:N-acetylmuramoyl-L-alanine amidase
MSSQRQKAKGKGWFGLLFVFAFAVIAFAQGVQTRDVNVPGGTQKALMYNGVAFAGLEYALSLGLDYSFNNDAVVLQQGGKVIRLALEEDGAYSAATQWTNGISVNGVRQRSPAAALGAGNRVLIPIRSVAEAAGADFSESGGSYNVSIPQAKLGTVSSDKTEASDRIVLELNRDVGFSSRIEKEELIVTLRFTSGDAAPYQVGGKFVDIFDVKQNAGKLEVRVPLKKEFGYNVFAVAAAPSIPARVVVDVGPRFERVRVALESRPSIVVLDAGHGGKDTGVVAGRLREKDIALNMAQRINAILVPRGITVRLTRSNDSDVSLESRQALSIKADVLVSLHASSLPGSAAAGMEIFYLSPDAASEGILDTGRSALENSKSERERKLLGRFLSPRAASQRLADTLSARILSLPNGAARVSSLFSHTALARAPKAAIVVELGFLSSQTDRELLQDPNQSVIRAEAIAYAILEHLGKPVPAPKPATPTTPGGAPR